MANDVTEHVKNCFIPSGFSVLQGDISLARENTPIEQVSLGSTEAYINESAAHDLTGMEVLPMDSNGLAALGWNPSQLERAPA